MVLYSSLTFDYKAGFVAELFLAEFCKVIKLQWFFILTLIISRVLLCLLCRLGTLGLVVVILVRERQQLMMGAIDDDMV